MLGSVQIRKVELAAAGTQTGQIFLHNMESFNEIDAELEKQLSQLTRVFLSETITKFSRNNFSDGNFCLTFFRFLCEEL